MGAGCGRCEGEGNKNSKEERKEERPRLFRAAALPKGEGVSQSGLTCWPFHAAAVHLPQYAQALLLAALNVSQLRR